MTFSLIAAADSRMGIGKNGRLPWHLPADLKFFHDVTMGAANNAVLMGRVTWESIPPKHRPLPGRLNIVITRQADYKLPQDVLRAGSLQEALDKAATRGPQEILVIGGAQIFDEAIRRQDCQKIYLTHLKGDFGCDAFFPKIESARFKEVSRSNEIEENGIRFRFLIYQPNSR